MSLRFGTLYVPPTGVAWALVVAAPLITLGTLWWLGIYRLVTRYIGYRGVSQVTLAVGLATLLWALLVFMTGQNGIPRSVIIWYALGNTLLLNLVRYAIKLLLDSVDMRLPRLYSAVPLKPTFIYGAGHMGIELLANVRRARDRDVIGFVDSSPTLWRQYVHGVKVFDPNRLPRLIEREGICEVLVAIPDRRERRDVLRQLEPLPVVVKVLPAYADIDTGHTSINDLRDVEVGDLLGRDPVRPNSELMTRNTRGKSILVTGAGGSIGSELVRQVVSQQPRLLVLFDISEPALYKIELEVNEVLSKLAAPAKRPIIKSVLGSVLDARLVSDVIEQNAIETIYHAAAYKHVPIVEHNPIAGLDNNVFGTRIVAECARNAGVERFVLISTDKAVRPTNTMGASKRLAELVLQAMASDQNGTVFTVVRFGNVLDSSGSVVPRFRQQIRAGGPITVTHPEVTRYFMSIPEAAELVIQAGAMAKGGEVFVLQMGDPVRIDDLARLMVRLSNLEVRDASNPDGDIAITYTGLRPGEKLYEELLIGAHTEATEHQRIFKSDEPFLTPSELKVELDQLRKAMDGRDMSMTRAVLLRTVEGYRYTPATPAMGDRQEGSADKAWEDRVSQTLH
ncbi:polysaccharide biosynthesis protein [Hyphomicrobium sp. DMF-1]|uniref:polysaccharide biosynthesis protein n=1 Tax=Hyphomicrobium sp. DMF-1 TaxID=3019544 RepID=UPI0022EBCF2A|nr:nucleoside-diphosphate sugar epimerase/dehydratase [Hyphomicrobium sp. DMF-1]WBT38280.1 nucleoside-diphosphate sugar epimerase/dehydratase [Hyphomicrobium sp. DMF-1]